MPITVVCLPAGLPAGSLSATAHDQLARHGQYGLALAPHFTATRRRRRLLAADAGTAAGGPVRLLHLDAQRAAAHLAAWHHWQLWQQVVDGTRVAQPRWRFVQRHREAPGKYSLTRAHGDFVSQPRVAAMRLFNAVPHRRQLLRTADLEALQAGAHAFAHLGWLAAIPADGLLTADGRLIAATGERLAERTAYLARANEELAALSARDVLVAVATAGPPAG